VVCNIIAQYERPDTEMIWEQIGGGMPVIVAIELPVVEAPAVVPIDTNADDTADAGEATAAPRPPVAVPAYWARRWNLRPIAAAPTDGPTDETAGDTTTNAAETNTVPAANAPRAPYDGELRIRWHARPREAVTEPADATVAENLVMGAANTITITDINTTADTIATATTTTVSSSSSSSSSSSDSS
jgi:hypothetical protein